MNTPFEESLLAKHIRVANRNEDPLDSDRFSKHGSPPQRFCLADQQRLCWRLQWLLCQVGQPHQREIRAGRLTAGDWYHHWKEQESRQMLSRRNRKFPSPELKEEIWLSSLCKLPGRSGEASSNTF